MKIKNLTVKPIGFGSTVILPDEVGTLPQGYGKNHPTVKYYLSRKWIKEIGGGTDNGGTPAAVNVGVNVNTGDGENPGGADNGADGENPGGADNGADGENPGGSADNGAGGNSSPNKSLDRMNKEELQALAFQRGIQFVEADTRQVLIDKIKAAQNGNE